MMKGWNHRVVRLKDNDLVFAEVYYDDETGKPDGWSDPFFVGADIGEMLTLVERLRKACCLPVIDEQDMEGNYNPQITEEKAND